jgi:hypothetical protein
MMDKDVQDLMRTMQGDQAKAAAVTLASLLAAYFRALSDGGMDEMHAYLLVQDFQRQQLWRALWPDTPPFME